MKNTIILCTRAMCASVHTLVSDPIQCMLASGGRAAVGCIVYTGRPLEVYNMLWSSI